MTKKISLKKDFLINPWVLKQDPKFGWKCSEQFIDCQYSLRKVFEGPKAAKYSAKPKNWFLKFFVIFKINYLEDSEL